MKKIARNSVPGDSDLSVAYDGEDATFTFPVPEGAPEGTAARTVIVRTDDTHLRFFPERSAGHRDVLKALGVAP